MYTDIVKKTPILSLLGDKDSIQEWGEGKYWGQFLLGFIQVVSDISHTASNATTKVELIGT